MSRHKKDNSGLRGAESALRQLEKLLSSREFSSADEANAFLQQTLAVGGGRLPEPEAESPLERAQDLMFQAWEARGSKRVKLARKAIELSPDCADAYLLLAEEAARSEAEAFDLVQQAVAAGERAVGPEAFQEDVGHFWGLIETRPYMRARAALAHMLWQREESAEAVRHLQEMLRLNPGDNQGLRYVLLDWLIELGDNEAAEELLGQYGDDAGASWAWARALLAFRRHGDSPAARERLKEAMESNRYVLAFLLGKKALPREMPQFIGMGDEREAVSVVYGQAPAWIKTPGAREWLAEATKAQGSTTRKPGGDKQ